MKSPPANRWWKAVVVLAACGVIGRIALCQDAADNSALTRTRLALREQGFQANLSDFDFSTSPEMQVREAVLNATAPSRNAPPFTDHPNLMESVGTNSAIVVWKLDVLKRQTPSWPDNGTELAWDDFREIVNQNQSQLDAACAAILSGPIQFNLRAGDGNSMRLPHLAILKNLTEFLDDRTMLALHDRDLAGAYSNLMAATRLVTAWKVEPAEVSHRVRFDIVQLVFATTWQALQTNGWTDEQCVRLQQEWEAAEFLADLPEIAAFRCASDLKEADYEPPVRPRPRPSIGEFSGEALDDPTAIWYKLLFASRQRAYLKQGSSADKRDMLLFYRDREIELRNAVKSPNWAKMRNLPGVTNAPVFHSIYPTRAEMRRNLSETSRRFRDRGKSLLAAAAEAETERRLVVTALALERYRARHGAYPEALAGLVPEFLKAVSPDFMNGQVLCYHRTGQNYFALYSVGLDCEDDGGKFQPQRSVEDFVNPFQRTTRTLPADLVWPMAATTANAMAQRQQEQKVQAEKVALLEERERANQAEAETLRQAIVKKLLAQKPVKINDPTYRGKPLSIFLQSQQGPVTNKLTLEELLSARQVVTGEEPDMATFEVPIPYDVATNIGELYLLVDEDKEDREEGYGFFQECCRATNGNCLLIWNTTYFPPGQHALQTELDCTEQGDHEHSLKLKGPVIPYYSSNVLQFSAGSDMFTDKGATLHAQLAELHGIYTIELKSPTGEHIRGISGTTSNGVIDVFWDLKDDHGNKYTNDSLNAVFNVTLPDSGRSQSTKGP